MGVFFVYILKSSLCLALFYLFYRLLLSKETFHRFNRLALLGLLAFSSAIPFVEVTMEKQAKADISFDEFMLIPEVTTSVVIKDVSVPFPWMALVLLVYGLGIVFFMGRHLWSLRRMCSLLRASRREKMEEGVILFVHKEKVAPFSWMNMIVVSEEDLLENGEVILTHERAHIKNRHSCDLLLAEVCVFFQWFNPAAWLLKQELQTIHEYEADEWVIKNGIDAKTYQLLIIKKAVGTRLYSIANSFNHSSLKKRITMMIKKKSNPWARLKYLYVLPLATVAVAAFARPEVSNEFNEISSVKVNDLTSIVRTNEVKGVEDSLNEKFILNGQVMKYPAKKPLVGASVVIRGTTIGTTSDADGKFQLSVNKGDVVVVSFVGLQTQFVPVEGNSNLVVWMRDDVQKMEEMVVYAPDSSEAENEERGPVVFDMPIEKIEKDAASENEGTVYSTVEQMPMFPGGMQAAMEFLGKNMKYPVAAQKAKIEGRVIVQFVVDKDGSITKAQVVNSVSPELDAEAIRVVNLMPKWNPGKQRGQEVPVMFTMPITFRLQTPQPKAEEDNPPYHQLSLKVGKDVDEKTVDEIKEVLRYRNNSEPLKIRGAEGKSPLIIVDGEIKGNGVDILNSIPVAQIESISVMKGQDAITQYGDKAKDGCIAISTKKNR